jgi:type III secretion protein T
MALNYVEFYDQVTFAQSDLLPALSLMFLFMGRILPIIALAPFFGARVMPRPAKVTLAISLFVVFLPQLVTTIHQPLQFNFTLVLYLIKEIFVGYLLGFVISIPFIIVQNAGILIDHQRGGASLMVNDPLIQNQSSPLGTLFNFVLIYLFFAIDGPFLILDILSQSYTVLPPDQFLNPAFFDINSPVTMHIVHILGNVMILSTQLAAPALIMVLMADFFLGIANRLAPQVQITFLGMPLKSLLALVVVFLGWQLFNQEVIRQMYKFIHSLVFFIQQLQPTT